MSLSEQELVETTAVLRALAEPNRLRILSALMAGNSCNCELQESLDMPANLLSHHLRVLAKVGLVDSRRDELDGRWIYYTVNQQVAGRWQGWFMAFLDPKRIQERPLCGPEGQTVRLSEVAL